jgi:hypothetical protein
MVTVKAASLEAVLLTVMAGGIVGIQWYQTGW